MGLRAAPIVIVGALSAAPAEAGRAEQTRLRTSAEVVFRPGAMKPVGVALAVDGSHFVGRDGDEPPSLSLGAGARVEVFLDGEVRMALEPTVGLGVGALDSRCGVGWQGVGAHLELRPGLLHSLRTGSHVWLGASAEPTWLPFIARVRGGATVSLRTHRHPSKFKRDFREVVPNASVGLGLAHTFDCTSVAVGRPLRDGQDVVLPQVDAPSNLCPQATTWLQQAREEHAASAAFLRLAAELAMLDAPGPLVRKALAAAGEEVGHAHICLDRASTLAHAPLTLQPVPTHLRTALSRHQLLTLLHRESLLDGLINEGLAAADAAHQAHTATDPHSAAIHARIAHEELGHAALALQIVQWCNEQRTTNNAPQS